MQGRVTTITADGRFIVHDYDSSPALNDLQEAVGGYLETIPFFTSFEGAPCIAFCDEEGKLKRKFTNVQASQLWASSLAEQGRRPWDILVGDVIVITGDEEFMESL